MAAVDSSGRGEEVAQHKEEAEERSDAAPLGSIATNSAFRRCAALWPPSPQPTPHLLHEAAAAAAREVVGKREREGEGEGVGQSDVGCREAA